MRGAIAVLICVGTVASCRLPYTQLPLGTRVSIDDLYQQRADLPGFIQRELDAKHEARAFYALELVKTQPYSEQALAARDKAAPKLAVQDLRPVFAAEYKAPGPAVAMVEPVRDRGLVLVNANTAAKQFRVTSEAAFWSHMRQFEKRTAALNETTIGIPYDYAARRGYGVSTFEEVARLFGPNEAFVSYFVRGEIVSAFVIARGKIHVARLPIGASALRAKIDDFVKLVRTPGNDAWQVEARALHAAVLAPLETWLANVTALFISPHGFLANLPFAVLADARGLVLESRRVSYIPSASIYRQLLSRPILNRPPRMLAVGNAVYPTGVQPLGFAEKEAIAVSEMFPDGKLLRGPGATELEVGKLAPGYNILHFATHGVLLGRVVPGASSLLLTADERNDGFLSAAEIAGFDLSHSYIAVLSACETSVSDDGGDLGSMTNAFLTAGAPSVLGTMWQVNDAATTVLMLDFYQQFLVVGAGEALRRAQLAVRKDPKFAHPFYWGAFALFGWDK